jgi:ribosomal-protein-alanine N-acetyltransferase
VYIIRKFKTTDTFDVIKLASTLLSERYDPTLFSYFYESFPWGMWVCEDHQHLIGFAIGIEYTETIGRIVMIAGLPKYRRKGVGSALLNQLMEEFKHRHLTIVELEVKTTNKQAISFYQKHQFEIIDLFPSFYQNGEDAYLMRRQVFPHTDY